MKLRIERLLSLRKVAAAEHPVASLVLPTVFLSGALVLGSTAIGQDTTAKSSGNTGSSLAVQVGNPQVSGAIMIEDKLRKLIVPEINLEDVPFEDAIVWFRQQSMELDKQIDPAGRGVNFILRASDRREALISIRLKSIPMWDALQYVCEMANVAVHIEPFAVMLQPPAEDDKIRSKTFMIDKEIFTEELERSGTSNARAWLESMGVFFHDGRGALFVPNPARILARNDQWNLKIAEKIIRSVSGESSADASAIEINRAKLKELILPEIKFSEASIDEVLNFVQMQSAKMDKITGEDGVKGVQIVNLAANESPITLSLRSVPVGVCVHAVANLAGLELSIQPYAIVLRPKHKSDLQLRTFRVPLSIADSLMESALASLEADGDGDDSPFADGETETTYSGGELWHQILSSLRHSCH